MKKKMILNLILLLCLTAYANSQSGKNEAFFPENKSPQAIAKMITADLLNRPELWVVKNNDYTAIHYSEACTGFGAARLAGFLHDSSTVQKLCKRYSRVFTDGPGNTGHHVDANVYGILPVELYMQTKDTVFLNQGIRLADQQWKDTLPNGLTSQTRFWIDDIWMIGSLQVQAYRATGNKIYLERAAKEAAAYIEKLQQPNGLFYHGENAKFFWGRGNGWVAAGLAEILTELPQSDPYYKIVVSGYKKMMQALLRYQADDGMWRQLIDHPEAWEESSSTGMFGYAMTVGVNRGILSREKYEPAFRKAWLALTDHITKEGKVMDICIGTGQSTDVNYYLNRPRETGDFHGQAPVLWFAYALLQK
jgi:unsaturated rhamnogalacturonyl hydrolase